MSGRVAIVGAGISGLSAAWSLRRAGAEVVVYERDAALGGHARTVRVPGAAGDTLVDSGVQVVCPPMYPHVTAMARMLGVRFVPYAANYTLATSDGGLYGPRHQDTALWREVEPECVRFTIEMSELMALQSIEVIAFSLGEYLASHGYSAAFVERMASLVALIGHQDVETAMDTSMVVLASAVHAGFISILGSPSHEMAFEGGVGAFVARLAAPLADCVRLGTGVATIRRSAEGVEVVDEHGGAERFDQVVLCVDGQLALALLEAPSRLEEHLLSECQLQTYASVVHRDVRVLIPGIPDERRTYVELREGEMSLNFSVLNLEKKRLDEPLFLTYERDPTPAGPAPIDRPLYRSVFRQARDSTYAFEVKRNLFRIQGQNRTWFASAWTTMSTFEHAAVSGLVIAEALGAPYPFPDDVRAARSYAILRALMLRGTESFPLG